MKGLLKGCFCGLLVSLSLSLCPFLILKQLELYEVRQIKMVKYFSILLHEKISQVVAWKLITT